MPPERNPVVRHGAILRKGGAHTKSVSGIRHQSKRQLDEEIDEYFDNHRSRKKRGIGTDKGRSKSAPSSLYNLVNTLSA